MPGEQPVLDIVCYLEKMSPPHFSVGIQNVQNPLSRSGFFGNCHILYQEAFALDMSAFIFDKI